MKENLIRLTGEKDLFYDSEDRLYRYRMHCPQCGKYSGCRCFDELEKAENFAVEGMNFLCSSRCFLKSLIDDQGIDDIGDTMKEMGIKSTAIRSKLKRFVVEYITNFFTMWGLKWYIFKYTGYISEKDAYEVIDTMELDFDSVEGELC